MIKQEQFEAEYKSIQDQKDASNGLNSTMQIKIDDMHKAFKDYLNTVRKKDQLFDEYMNLQKEVMYGKGDPLPFSNVFPGVSTPNRTLSDDDLKKTARLRELGTEINNQIRNALMQVSTASELLEGCSHDLERFRQQQEMILDSEKGLLEELDSPWDYLSQIGSNKA